MARDLAGEDITVLMLDGEHMAERCVVVALAITADGTKKPVGLWDGSTENKTVVRALLADLVDRGLDDDGLLVVLDGAKALSAAVRKVFGAQALIQRCTLHKRRNVADHLPERSTSSGQLAGELDRTYPGAAGSLREGLEETLTLTRLGVTGSLKRTLESTNPCESMIEIVRHTQRNVKRWSLRRDGAALDRRRHARSREAVSEDHRLPQPRHPRRRDRTRPRPSPSLRCRSHPDQGGRYRPQRLTITPGPPPRKSTASGTSSCLG